MTTAPVAAEAVAMRLMDLGARGAATTEADGVALVTVHLPLTADAFPATAIQQAVEKIDKAFGLRNRSRVERKVVDDAQWREAWKEHFKPLRVGRRLLITPSWEAPDAGPEDVVVEIDPQMAFGTGLHPTTQLCLRALENHMRPGYTAADIGTGSGILAIAAAKLGAARVDAVDNDSVAVETARENVRRNRTDGRVTVTLGSGVPGNGPYDLIVANITAPTVIEIAADVFQALPPGGLYVASGFASSKQEQVARALRHAGLSIIARETEQGWACLHCAKGAAEGRHPEAAPPR